MSASVYQRRLLLQLLNSRQRSKGTATQGFTLIELLVVIVILGVLGGIGYGAYVSQILRANQNTALVAATGAAKNCAALLATGDEAQFVSGVDGTRVELTAACQTNTTFTARAGGTSANSASATAFIDTNGAVIPGG